jgi:FMN phosphatase YigB (HAD superfamily)
MPILGGPVAQPPRAIIFDIGRVIIDVNFSKASMPGNNPPLSHAQVLKLLEADPQWKDWQEGRIAPRDWHIHFCERFHVTLSFDEFCAGWNALLEPRTILPESLFETLSASCQLALLSNTDPIHVAHIEATYPFVRFFPVRVYSCRVGCSKPQPLIYHHALRELAVLPEESMFIDDVRGNAVAAEALGISAFHFVGARELMDEFVRLGLCRP